MDPRWIRDLPAAAFILFLMFLIIYALKKGLGLDLAKVGRLLLRELADALRIILGEKTTAGQWRRALDCFWIVTSLIIFVYIFIPAVAYVKASELLKWVYGTPDGRPIDLLTAIVVAFGVINAQVIVSWVLCEALDRQDRRRSERG